MFSLEIYKFVRSHQLIWTGLSLIIPLALVFLGSPGDESDFYYNPLFNQVDLSWLHFCRNYDWLFFFFFPIFLFVFYSGTIYMDKKAGLLRFFTIACKTKAKFWVMKYLFLQMLTLIFILIYLCLPVFLYVLVYDPSVIGGTFILTGLFLSLKSWLALSSATTIIFIIQIVSTSFYMGLLLPMILYVWMFFIPGSPLILFLESIIFMQGLSLNDQPFVWNMSSFYWEITSLVFALILILLFNVIIYLFRHRTYFKRLFFGVAACMLLFTSCQNDQSQFGLVVSGSNAQKDSFLIEWLDTVQILDRQNNLGTLSHILESMPASIIYMDFWNSHCIPCMKAFPQIMELADQYQDTKLKVIYLNTDEDPTRWERALSFTNNLHNPDHYRVKHSDFKTFAKVGLYVYPRYLVMYRDREIIEYRAPVPYKKYIDSLLTHSTQ